MNEFNVEELIASLLNNPRIASRVKKLGLSKDQINEALPILIDMNEQHENDDSLYLTSFYVTDSGFVKRMEVLSAKGQAQEYLNKIVTKHIYDVNFDEHKEFKKSQNRQEIMTWIDNFFKNLATSSQGVYLHGEHNLGKTFILKRIARKLAQQNNRIGYVLLPDLVNYLKSTFGNQDEYENVKDTLKKVDYLFIDDIGAESVTQWFRDEFLFLVLSYRIEKSKVTFFTSDYNLTDLMKVEAKTQNQKYQDYDKAKRLIGKIKILATPINLKIT